MQKILLIAPSRKMGGIERALCVLANNMVEVGFEILYVSCLRSEPFYPLNSKIQIIEPKFKRRGGLINKILFYPRLLFFLRLTVLHFNPNRVLVFGDWFSPISLLALLGTKYPVYISDRTIPGYNFHFPIPQLKKLLYPNSAGFIAQTQRAKIFKERIFGDKLNICVIPNALPHFDFDFEIPRENVIIYVGRFAWEKDPEILIRSLPNVLSLAPEWVLIMAGSGPLLDSMKFLVKRLGLEGSVYFPGNVYSVEELYTRASILVLPSVIEGFPNTLIEGMAAGLPCICFSDIPYEDIVSPGFDGIVLERRDPELLADTIKELINNPEQRRKIGKAATNVKERFSASKISDQVLRFMEL